MSISHLLGGALAILMLASSAWSDELETLDAGHVPVTRRPWSGYWWPQREGEIRGPLGKYDHLTGANATAWEDEHHPAGPQIRKWHGYCHAWAASAVMEREPTQPRVATHAGRRASLSVADQKGLLAASHADDVANTYGDRFGDPEGANDPGDLAPDALWRLLSLHIKQQQTPLILDLEAGEEVWNYPVYAFRVVLMRKSGDEVHEARLELWMADDAVPGDFVGLKVKYQTYAFRCRMNRGSVVMGSGRWTGASIEDHPDFAWAPLVAQPENPEIDYALVQELLGLPATPSPSADFRPEPASSGDDNAETPLSPAELLALMSRRSSAFLLDVTIDRFDGAHYRAGEPFQVTVSSEKAGYLYLFHVSPGGELALIYPTAKTDHRIGAGTKVVLPAANSGLVFRAAPPPGAHRIKAVVASRPIRLSGLALQPPGPATPPEFRWHPALRSMVAKSLRADLLELAPPLAELAATDLRRLGEFSQDEVAFHVGVPRAR
jgi:hypothetical protein